MRRLIVVDGENIASRGILNDIVSYNSDCGCRNIVIIGSKQKIKRESQDIHLDFIRCSFQDSNCADFVLVSALALELQRGLFDEAVIISRDKGFTGAINYLNSVGFCVRRESSTSFLTSNTANNCERFIEYDEETADNLEPQCEDVSHQGEAAKLDENIQVISKYTLKQFKTQMHKLKKKESKLFNRTREATKHINKILGDTIKTADLHARLEKVLGKNSDVVVKMLIKFEVIKQLGDIYILDKEKSRLLIEIQ